jgi:AAA domain/Primase C terminal 2 (PriCT-2)
MKKSTNASGFGHYTRPTNPKYIGPQELHQLSRWVMFKAVHDPLTGKLNKLPTTLNGQNASVSNPETWVGYDQALEKLQKDSNKPNSDTSKVHGIGFVFNGDGIYGIDLDDVRDPITGAIKPSAKKILDSVQGYKEVSISGKGFHIITKGIPPWTGRRVVEDYKVEVYKTGRFFTMSGDVYDRCESLPKDQVSAEILAQIDLSSYVHEGAKSYENLKTPDPSWDLDRVKREILDRLPIDLDYDDWLTVGMVLSFQFSGAQEACMAFDEFSLLRPKYPQGSEQTIEQKWKSFGKSDKNNRTIGTLLRMRDEHEKKAKYESKLNQGVPLFSRLVDAQKELKEVNWQVENMVKQGELVMISAPPASGKTYFALEMALSIATGNPMWGKHKTKKGTVVYIANEDKDGVIRRAIAWAKQKNGGITPPNIFISNSDLVVMGSKDADNSIQSAVKFFKENQIKPDFIVIDTLVDSLGSANENEANDMAEYFRAIQKELIAPFGATVVLPHHNNKSGGYRGSTAIFGKMGHSFEIEQPTEGNFRITNKKNKHGAAHAPYFLKGVPVDIVLPNGVQEGNLVLEPVEPVLSPNGFNWTLQQVLKILHGSVGLNGSLSKIELRKQLQSIGTELSPKNLSRDLRPLIAKGYVRLDPRSITLLKIEGVGDFDV